MSRIVTMLVLAGLTTGLIGVPTSDTLAAKGAVGDRVPAAIFCDEPGSTDDWDSALKLVVLAPQRSDYGDMLRLAFDAYFRRGGTFRATSSERSMPEPTIKLIQVDGRALGMTDLVWSSLDSDCTPAGPAHFARIAAATGVTLPKADHADATVLLLDAHDVVRWRDDAYRAQGEHLKPLEAAVKSLLGRSDPVVSAPDAPPPRVGEPAPDFMIPLLPGAHFALSDGEPGTIGPRLSALRGKVVLITFYPAAFSGILPTVEGTSEEKAAAALRRERTRMMSCALQLDELDLLAPDAALRGDVVKLAVSASTPEILSAWRRALGTRDLHYVNDPDYAIARRYGSFDAAAGYNLRKVFIIGRDGRVAYVDEDYTPGDAQAVADALAAASVR